MVPSRKFKASVIGIALLAVIGAGAGAATIMPTAASVNHADGTDPDDMHWIVDPVPPDVVPGPVQDLVDQLTGDDMHW